MDVTNRVGDDIVAVPELLLALAENWERVTDLLDQADRDQLRRLIVQAADIDPADESELLRVQVAIATFVAGILPDGDPVLHALRSDRLVPTADRRLNPASLTSVLLARLGDDGELTAHRWILAAPWEMATELRVRGVDPDHPDLIRLDHGSGYAVPSFQFDGSGTPIPLVLLVNHVLGAMRDPWGAAHWWLSTNPWLARRPADLIDQSADDDLVAAAVAAVEG